MLDFGWSTCIIAYPDLGQDASGCFEHNSTQKDRKEKPPGWGGVGIGSFVPCEGVGITETQHYLILNNKFFLGYAGKKCYREAPQ